MSVVGFHAFPLWVKGGFIGVDVFFVISGFLISTIIFGSLERNAFSFTEFYGRRIRRIFPALILVLAVSYALGWFILLPDEYKQLGKHIAAGAGFVSNFALWNESGYFDNASDTKPLLHLWSLGIEEQFYIIWPLMLWAAWKKRFNLFFITILIAIISLALNITGIGQDAISTFYLPHTRFWELLAGALLAWIFFRRIQLLSKLKSNLGRLLDVARFEPLFKANNNTLSNVQSVVGVSLILVAVLIIEKGYDFPGWWALLPVIGTLLLISAGAHAWINRTLLSRKILVWMGLISYPLYLWHWPILSFIRIIESETPVLWIRVMAIIASVFLAWLTYEFVEKPLRFGLHKKKIFALMLALAIIGIVGYGTYVKGGLAFRMKEEAEFMSYFENERPQMRYFEKLNLFTLWKPECAYFDFEKYRAGKLGGEVAHSKPRESISSTCYERDPKYGKSVLLWGDSYAQALSPGLQKYLPADYQLLQIATSACPPNLNSPVPSTTSQCGQSNHMALKTIYEVKPDVVVLTQAKAQSATMYQATANRLKQLGVGRVLIVGPTPQWKSNLPKLLLRRLSNKSRRLNTGLNEETLAQNLRLRQDFRTDASQQYIDIIRLFCNSEGCMTYLGDDVRTGIVSWDRGHLTPVASEYLAEKILVPAIISP